jgi:hypothetical protein
MTIIKAVPEERGRGDDGSEESLNSEGKLRYRTNCLGKLIIQVRLDRFIFGKGWRSEWVDAKSHHIRLVDE